MDTVDWQSADAVAPQQENEEIKLLRGQAAALTAKVAALRVKWMICGGLAIAGCCAPIGMLFLYDSAITSRAKQQAAQVEEAYRERIQMLYEWQSTEVPPAESDAKYKPVTKENVRAVAEHLTAWVDSKERVSREVSAVRAVVKEDLEAADARRKSRLDAINGKNGADETMFTLALGVAFSNIALMPLLYVLWVALHKRMLERGRYKLEYKIVEAKARQLQDKIGEDFFTRLVQINFKYLDQYYFQTHQQANKSFALSVAASIVGLVIVLAAIGMVLLGHKEPASLTAVVGGLSQFIAAVFFYLYNRTVLKMGEYHKKLVLTQNIGIALKITDLLPAAEKAETQRALVGQLTFNINQFLSEIETSVPAPVPA